MQKQETLLDLNNIKLYGSESEKSDKTIDAIIKGIEHKDRFPTIPVLQLSENEYALTKEHKGHHRAVGHYIANQPLRVRITKPNNSTKKEKKNLIWIGDIILIDDNLLPFNYERRKFSKFYR